MTQPSPLNTSYYLPMKEALDVLRAAEVPLSVVVAMEWRTDGQGAKSLDVVQEMITQSPGEEARDGVSPLGLNILIVAALGRWVERIRQHVEAQKDVAFETSDSGNQR